MKKLLVVLLAFGISLGLASTALAQDKGNRNGGKNEMKRDGKRGGPAGQAFKGAFIKDEDVRKEMERFEKEMQGLHAKRKDLRETVQKAVKDAEKKAGKSLTPDEAKAVIAGYKDKIVDIFTQIVDAQVKHHRNLLDIVEKKKQTKIQEMVDRFLQGPPKGQPGQPGQRPPQPGGQPQPEAQPEGQPGGQPSGGDDFWGD